MPRWHCPWHKRTPTTIAADWYVSAIHESAHCLAEMVLDPRQRAPITRVELSRHPSGCVVGQVCGPASTLTPAQRVTALLAGSIAESLITGHDLQTVLATSGRQDVELAKKVLNSPTLPDALISEAQQLVILNWSKLQRIATVLAQYGSLNHADVIAAVQGTLPPKNCQ